MINLALTVREALWILAKCEDYTTIYDKIAKSIEDAVQNAPKGTNVTIKSIPVDNFIDTIKIVRKYTSWGLKTTKDWCDVIRGQYQSGGYWEGDNYIANGSYAGGVPNTLTLTFGRDAISMADELRKVGCVVRGGDCGNMSDYYQNLI
jgi:hypothetical protein